MLSSQTHRMNPKYDLGASQVVTPLPVVRFFWRVAKQVRPRLGSVLDLGAGDGRFARYGHFQRYRGIEIDPLAASRARLPKNASLQVGCAFAMRDVTYDACIGNPPYLRHHEIESPWKERTIAGLEAKLGTTLDAHGNLFLYFMALALARTTSDGLVALLVPFDWASRPSAKGIRTVLDREGWAVRVYRFTYPIFSGVTTTASISIIDKSSRDSTWRTYDVSSDFSTRPRRGLTGTGKPVLAYSPRGNVYARRGLSPGSQHIFTLSEGERVHHGLRRSDVVPCVTSLRGFPSECKLLNEATFTAHFIEAGRRCWLIRSSARTLSKTLRTYLDAIPIHERATATCCARSPWYAYESTPVPTVLVHSGFTREGPKTLINSLGAVPVGSMYGVYAPKGISAAVIARCISSARIHDRVVPHSGRLRKVEVAQLNAVLADKWPRAVHK